MAKQNALNRYSDQFAVGEDAEGTTDANKIIVVRTDQDDATVINVRNENNTGGETLVRTQFILTIKKVSGGALAEAGIALGNDITNAVGGLGTDIQNRLCVYSNIQALGNTYRVGSSTGTHIWTTGISAANGIEVGKIDSSGAWTKILQPACQSRITASYPTNVTGDGTVYTVTGGTWTDVFDQNSDFSNGTFVAPAAGRYSGIFTGSLSGLTAAHNRLNIVCVTTARSYTLMNLDVGAIRSAGGDRFYWSIPVVLADMAASDTATFTIEVAGSTKVVDINSAQISWQLQC